jgi:hypothetical protein
MLWIGLTTVPIAGPAVGAGNGYRLAYLFRPGQTLRYVVEKQDSVLDMNGAQKAEAVFYYRIMQTLRTEKADDNGLMWIFLSTDSIWQGRNSPGAENNYEKMLFGREFNQSVEKMRITSSGMQVSANSRFIPFLIPLPEHPMSVDGGWNFVIKAAFEKPYKGVAQASGACQLFRMSEDKGDTLAVFAIQMEKTNSARMDIREPFQTITTVYEAADKGNGAAYFNLTRGCMVKGILQWSGSVFVTESKKTNSYIKKSRLTFQLLTAGEK